MSEVKPLGFEVHQRRDGNGECGHAAPHGLCVKCGWSRGWQTAQENAAEIARLQAENATLRAKVPRWIPVGERLPDPSTPVCAHTVDHGDVTAQVVRGVWSLTVLPDRGDWVMIPHSVAFPAPPMGMSDVDAAHWRPPVIDPRRVVGLPTLTVTHWMQLPDAPEGGV